MELKEDSSTLNNPSIKKVKILDSTQVGERTIITHTPILMYDSLGTIVTVCDPLKPLKSKEELALYTLSSLKSYNQKNEEILKRTIHELEMDQLANTIHDNLVSKNLPQMAIFYALVDIITEEFCKKIGDPNQEQRLDILLKTHKLADPRIFEYINEYSKKTFNADISQLILTQDNPIMKEVYNKMLKGYDVEVFTVPNPQFGNLRKDNPELYTQLATYLGNTPNNIGFYDDTEKNLIAARQIGILTQLATGIKNDNPEIIKIEASNLVEQLFNDQKPYRIGK